MTSQNLLIKNPVRTDLIHFAFSEQNLLQFSLKLLNLLMFLLGATAATQNFIEIFDSVIKNGLKLKFHNTSYRNDPISGLFGCTFDSNCIFP